MALNRKDIRTASNGVTLEHRHFAFIAATIDAMPHHSESLRAHKSSVANAFADACAQTNPRFDRHHFLMACSVSLINSIA